MAYTPVFRLNPIGRQHLETGEVFQASDPWNGDRACTYTVEHYHWIRASADMYAIWSDADDVERFLPDSLCHLYRHGQVPASSLPALLKSIEPGLERSDYLGLYQSAGFNSGYSLYPIVYFLMTLVALFSVVMTETPLPRAIAIMAGVIGIFWGSFHWVYRRKMIRRAAQQKRLRAFLQATSKAAPPMTLLTLPQIKASIEQLRAQLGFAPDQLGLPKFIKDTHDDWYVAVDDQYHLFLQDRGVRHDVLSTTDLDALQYRIMRDALEHVGVQTRPDYAVAGISTTRIWHLRQGDLLGRLNPAWQRQWAAEAAEKAARWPYDDKIPTEGRWPSLEFSEAHRFTLGVDLETGQYYLAIPVSNRMVDYLEYYVISAPRYAQFRAAHDSALPFLAQARARELDHLLILKPGTDRGVPS